MPTAKKAIAKKKVGRLDDDSLPVGVPYFVLQVQDAKNGPWKPTEEGWDEWHDKQSALQECKEANEQAVRDAQKEYERPSRLNFTRVQVGQGDNLDAILEEVKRLHKQFNPTTQKKPKPFDPTSVYPRYRVVARTIIDEPLES